MTRFDIFEQRQTENGTLIVIVRWLSLFSFAYRNYLFVTKRRLQ